MGCGWLVDTCHMDESQVAAVSNLALNVRRCTQTFKGRHAGFHDFPNGSCKRTSAILQAVLHDAGLGNWTHCNGENRPVDSHTWLELDGWCLDATLDQYGDFDGEIFLVKGEHPRKRHYPRTGVIPSSWVDEDETARDALNEVRAMLNP